MDVMLSKSADQALCVVYKQYLNRLKNGASQAESADFGDFDAMHAQYFPSWSSDDIHQAVIEFTNTFGIKRYVPGGFNLNSQAIIFMQNRFRRGLSELIDFIAKFV